MAKRAATTGRKKSRRPSRAIGDRRLEALVQARLESIEAHRDLGRRALVQMAEGAPYDGASIRCSVERKALRGKLQVLVGARGWISRQLVAEIHRRVGKRGTGRRAYVDERSPH